MTTKKMQPKLTKSKFVNTIDSLLPLRKARAETLLMQINKSSKFCLTDGRYKTLMMLYGLTRGNTDTAINDLADVGLIIVKPNIDGILIELNKEDKNE